MTFATVGSRFQVVIPKEERKRLKLRPNTKVAIEARDDHLVIFPVRDSGPRGLGKELANGTDAGDYVKRLRQEWSRRA